MNNKYKRKNNVNHVRIIRDREEKKRQNRMKRNEKNNNKLNKCKSLRTNRLTFSKCFIIVKLSRNRSHSYLLYIPSVIKYRYTYLISYLTRLYHLY